MDWTRGRSGVEGEVLMHDARQMLSHALRRPRTDTHLCIEEAIQVNAVAHVSKSQIIIYMQTIIRVP